MAAPDSSPESNENHGQYKFGGHQNDEGGMRRTGEVIGKAPANATREKHRAQKRHSIQMQLQFPGSRNQHGAISHPEGGVESQFAVDSGSFEGRRTVRRPC